MPTSCLDPASTLHSPPAAAQLTWVRFRNGRLVPVDTETGDLVAIMDTELDGEAGLEAKSWTLAMRLSFALCGCQFAFEAAIESAVRAAKHRRVGRTLHLATIAFPMWRLRHRFDWCDLYSLEQIKAFDPVDLAEGLGIKVGQIAHLLASAGKAYGDESVIEVAGGRELRCPPSRKACRYVRLTTPGIVPLELDYWDGEDLNHALELVRTNKLRRTIGGTAQ